MQIFTNESKLYSHIHGEVKPWRSAACQFTHREVYIQLPYPYSPGPPAKKWFTHCRLRLLTSNNNQDKLSHFHRPIPPKQFFELKFFLQITLGCV